MIFLRAADINNEKTNCNYIFSLDWGRGPVRREVRASSSLTFISSLLEHFWHRYCIFLSIEERTCHYILIVVIGLINQKPRPGFVSVNQWEKIFVWSQTTAIEMLSNVRRYKGSESCTFHQVGPRLVESCVIKEVRGWWFGSWRSLCVTSCWLDW